MGFLDGLNSSQVNQDFDWRTLMANQNQQGISGSGVPIFQGQNVVGTPASQIIGSGQDSGWSWFDKVNKEGMTTKGALGFGLGALQAGAGLFLGNKQLGLAEDQFAESKRQFSKNFGAQVQNYNTNLADRQNRRYTGAGGDTVASNPYESTTPYMDKNRMVG